MRAETGRPSFEALRLLYDPGLDLLLYPCYLTTLLPSALWLPPFSDAKNLWASLTTGLSCSIWNTSELTLFSKACILACGPWVAAWLLCMLSWLLVFYLALPLSPADSNVLSWVQSLSDWGACSIFFARLFLWLRISAVTGTVGPTRSLPAKETFWL